MSVKDNFSCFSFLQSFRKSPVTVLKLAKNFSLSCKLIIFSLNIELIKLTAINPCLAKIAKGRVWSGKEALDLELIDEIGNLEKAIDYAANKVNIKKADIKIKEFPKKENDELIAMLAELEFSSSNKNEILNFLEDFNSKLNKTVLNPVKQDKFQMLFPFEIKIQ